MKTANEEKPLATVLFYRYANAKAYPHYHRMMAEAFKCVLADPECTAEIRRDFTKAIDLHKRLEQRYPTTVAPAFSIVFPG